MFTQKILSQLLCYKNGVIADSLRNAGINYARSYGVPVIDIKRVSKDYFPNHNLALELFARRERECKIAAVYIDNPAEVTISQIDDWAKAFNNVEITEQVCLNLFGKTSYAATKIEEWISNENKFLQQAAWNLFAKSENIDREFLQKIISYNFNYTNVQSAAIQALVSVAHSCNAIGEICESAKKLLTSSNENTKFVGSEVLAFIL